MSRRNTLTFELVRTWVDNFNAQQLLENLAKVDKVAGLTIGGPNVLKAAPLSTGPVWHYRVAPALVAVVMLLCTTLQRARRLHGVASARSGVNHAAEDGDESARREICVCSSAVGSCRRQRRARWAYGRRSSSSA